MSPITILPQRESKTNLESIEKQKHPPTHQIHLYIQFPLYSPQHRNNSLREIHQPLNSTLVEVKIHGTTLELIGDQTQAVTLTPYPFLAQIDVYITCLLS